jgi:Zn-dependent protease with chaperone function
VRPRLNTANRSFVTLVAFALVPYGLIGLFCCGALSLLAYRVSTEGLSALTGDWRIWPAIGFFAVVGAGTVRALLSLRTQLRATERLGQHVHALELAACPKLEKATTSTSLTGRVVHIDDERAFSFTFGLLHPQVAVSRGLVDVASPDELSAALEHERYHVRNLDPVKVLVARAAGPALFYLPVLRDLRRRYVAGRELAADRRAARACGPQPLAGALYKVTAGPTWSELGAAAAIGADDLLDLRVTQLETGREPAIPQTSRSALAASVVALGLLGAALTFSLVTLGDPATLFAMSNGTTSTDTATNVVGMLGCVALWSVIAWAITRRVRARRA